MRIRLLVLGVVLAIVAGPAAQAGLDGSKVNLVTLRDSQVSLSQGVTIKQGLVGAPQYPSYLTELRFEPHSVGGWEH